MNKAILKKDNQEIPDFHELKIDYIDGSKETIKCVGFTYYKESDIYELWTHEDKMIILPKVNIKAMYFDKNWTKFLELRSEEEAKKEKEKK